VSPVQVGAYKQQRELVSHVGQFLQIFVTVGWFLQIHKNNLFWFSPKRVSILNIVSSSYYIYVIVSLWFMNFKKKKIALYLFTPLSV
jgi:hypothetical protein